jgi:hypothetical protein
MQLSPWFCESFAARFGFLKPALVFDLFQMATTTAHKVFETPELLSLISSYNTLNGCAQLICTSKSAFYAAVPFVWSYVEDVRDLLVLFPQVAFHDNRSEVVCGLCSFSFLAN